MPFDAVFLHSLVGEINKLCAGGRVEKIYQPERDEIMLLMHTKNGNMRLLVSASVNNPRVQITRLSRENPAAAPMFCMLLRKHLTGARLENVSQLSFERVAMLTFLATNELGDESRKSLILEVLGRQTNIILTDEDDSIIDSLRKTDISEKATRQIIPGVKYALPDSYGKLNPLTEAALIEERILSLESGERADKFIMSNVMGFSPLIARELVFRAEIDSEIPVSELDFLSRKRLAFEVCEFIKKIEENRTTPYLQRIESDKLKDFTVISVSQYGEKYQNIEKNSFSELLDEYYDKKERAERMKNKAAQLTKFCQNTLSKLQKKTANQITELKASKDREKYRLYGELITANISTIEKGASFAMLPNYYEEGMPLIKVPLNPQHNAARNAQDAFKKYAKLKTAEKMLTEQIEKATVEAEYISSVLDLLSRCESESEIADIRSELITGGYIKRGSKDKKQKNNAGGKPIEYSISAGFIVLVGRNNIQNDILAMKTANKDDLWFHVLGATGSHAILLTQGREVSDEAVTDAAEIAAFHSSSRMGNNVGVTCTKAKNLKKPNGSKPGFVTYSTSRTVYVTPEEEKINKMRKGL